MGVTFGLIGLVAVSAALFRFHGVSGDLAPILEFRWAKNTPPGALPATALTDSAPTVQRFNASTSSDFPQYLGSKGNGVLAGPRLDANWEANPPAVVWRKEVGPAWSGFAIVGEICVTPEQRGEDECVVAYELATGKQIWLHADKAHYHTTIAGEGPRATPTILNNRVFACGSTGILNCMDLATGRLFWTRNVVAESGGFLSGALPVHRWWWVAW
jgi:outer membrane protein assembly factor BamB